MADGRTRDEDTFVVPVSWGKQRLPRRDGTAPAAPIPADTVQRVEAYLHSRIASLMAALRSRQSPADPELAAAGEAYLAGAGPATALGAAVVVTIAMREQGLDAPGGIAAFTEFWRARHGLAFAAAATAEAATLTQELPTFAGPGGVRRTSPLDDGPEPWDEPVQLLAFAMRAAIAAAPDDEYRAVVAALEPMRRDHAVQRVVISVMTPGETDWAEQDADGFLSSGDRPISTTLLLAAQAQPETLLRLAAAVSGHDIQNLPALLYSFAERTGARAVPILTGWADDDLETDNLRRIFDVLAVIPTDEAFTALLRSGYPAAATALQRAAGRFPRRALRLFAGEGAVAALRVLVAAHPDLVAQVRAELGDSAAGALLDEAVAANTPAGRSDGLVQGLPPILQSPPWLNRVRVKPLVADVEPCADPVTIAWEPGERERWLGNPVSHPDPARARAHARELIAKGYFAEHAAAGHFVYGEEEVVLPRLAGWLPRWNWQAHERDVKAIIARFQYDAYSWALTLARQWPATHIAPLAPFASPELATLIATWNAKPGPVRAAARHWLDRHPESAARALVPAAVGKPGAARTKAEAVLRVLDGLGHGSAVLAAAAGYGSAAATAVERMLAADPAQALPATMPRLPAWADPALLTPVRLTSTGEALPPDAVGHLVSMLAISRPGEGYAGLDQVRSACVPGDLAAFGWSLFEQWRGAGHPANQRWAYEALGHLGDDEIAERLTALIRVWPTEGASARAAAGLDILAAIGTDGALRQLDGVARKVKSRPLQEKAREKIGELAAGRGLTADQLADRLVPSLGLDPDGGLTLDYGPRQFRVGFDEQLKPYATTADGKRLKALPKPGVKDDPAAHQRFNALKKDVRKTADEQIVRLEEAMVAQRGWSPADFDRLFVRHPLLWHLVRRLVWTRADGAGFRLAEDRTYADVNDETVVPGADEVVRLAHPLLLAGELAGWVQVFADYEILQPFEQLGRTVFPGGPEPISAFAGHVAATGKWLRLERRGWRRDTDNEGGRINYFERELPGGGSAYAQLEPGVLLGMLDPDEPQELTSVRLPDGDLSPVIASELLRDLTQVLA